MNRSAALALVAASLFAVNAHASSEPRCWYGNDRPHCQQPQDSGASRRDAGLKSESNPGHETDHNRETTRPY